MTIVEKTLCLIFIVGIIIVIIGIIHSMTYTSKETEQTAIELDQSMADIYKWKLVGEHSAESDGNYYTFNFEADGSYEGYSSADPDDFGEYELVADGESFNVVITCPQAGDVYSIDFDSKNISLTNTVTGVTYTFID